MRVFESLVACALISAAVTAAVSAAEPGKHIQFKGGIIYSRAGSKNLKLDLYLPEGNAGPHPAVVLIHGGSWLFGTRHQLHWYARQLARNGYVAAAISYRMMPKYGFPYCLYDCKAAVRWLRAHASEFNIDPDRIAALGNSSGGHLTAMLAATTPKDHLEGTENMPGSAAIQTAIVLYGVTDLNYYRCPKGYINFFGFAQKFVRKFVTKDFHTNMDPYNAASPITYVSSKTCPTLLVHGTHDHQVPYAQATTFYEQLRRLGVPAKLITVPYGHAFDFLHRKARAAVFPQILDFLNEHLPPAK